MGMPVALAWRGRSEQIPVHVIVFKFDIGSDGLSQAYFVIENIAEQKWEVIQIRTAQLKPVSIRVYRILLQCLLETQNPRLPQTPPIGRSVSAPSGTCGRYWG
jgi:hypothetical protein